MARQTVGDSIWIGSRPLSDELLQSADIGAVALVRRSASLGFLASSIRLRVPNIHAIAASELSAVDHALRMGRDG